MTQTSAQTADNLRTRKIELVLQQLDQLPTLPAIAVRLLNLTGNTESKIQEVVKLIGADISLTSKVLSLVQSAAVGARAPVTTVHQAVVMLGFETIRNLILSVKVFEVFQHESAEPSGSFSRADFWKHSLAVATAAEMLASRAKLKLSPHDAFVCGLLHDLGKVAFDTVMPKSFARVVEVATLTRGDIADAERRIIGIDHGVAGKRLAEAWNLPGLIMQTIWLHGTAPMSMPQGIINPGMVQLIGLADMLVRRQHIGFSGNFLFPFDIRNYQTPLGLADGDIAAITQQLAEQLEERAKALGLYDVASKQLYLESISNANAELGRVNQMLASQNRKLATRSQCFEMLTKFYTRIVPAASPAQLLAEIGQVAHAFLEADRLILFSQDPDQQVGEVLTFDTQATLQDSFLMQMPPHAGDQRLGRTGGDFVHPAAPQLNWLMERIDGFVGHRRCWFMPLMCGTEIVGGVVWPAKEGHGNPYAGMPDLTLVSEAWGMTLRGAQIREQQNVLTEALAASNRELAALQQQLIRAKSLANLGEMAAGAAHEMNNPLAVVCGRAQLLATRLSDASLKQDAQLIAQQGERLSQIITDLMEFAKPTAPKLAPCAIRQIVDEAVREATQRAGLTHSVRCRIEANGDIPEARLDVRQVRAALTEVVVNAMQASPAADTASGHSPEVLVSIRHDTFDDQIVVQVTDRGAGMSEETMRQAFAPFYSAKTAGRQRGMGLAKALRWIELHGGTIRLDSVVGVGTTAVIILPQSRPPAPSDISIQDPAMARPLAGETH